MEIVRELLKTLALMYVGITLASWVATRPKFVGVLERALKPVVGNGRLSGAAVLASFSTSVAVYAARNTVRSTKDAVALLLLAAFPSALAASIQFYLPVVTPLVGLAGPVTVGAALASAAVVSLMGRVLDDNDTGSDPTLRPEVEGSPVKTATGIFVKVAPAVTVAMIGVWIARKEGVLGYVENLVAPVVTWVGLPPAAGLVVVGCLANVAVGAALGADLMASGKLNVWEVAVALTLGRAVSLPRIHLQFVMPPSVTFLGRRGLIAVFVRIAAESGTAVAVALAMAGPILNHCLHRM
ncbi:MAG: hypothetical protein GXO28_03285 [Methanopyri archaeon]|nr:hypothetical protein [Methanopyri archaeon]